MSETNITFTGTNVSTYTFTTHVATEEELWAINEESNLLASPQVQQEMLDILDCKNEPTLPMWMVLNLPFWLVNFLFWLKKK